MFLFAFAALGAQAAMVAKVGETAYETLDEAIKAVRDGETIVVNAGEYKLNDSLTYTGKAFTIQAAADAKVSFDMSEAVALSSAKITFAGVTFDYKTNGNYIGLQHTDTLVYNDCTVNGKVFLYAASETFNRCTFVQEVEDYNVWTYGAKAVTFNGCTFKNVGKTINAYIEGGNASSEPQKIEMADCTVESSKSNKAVVNIKNKTQAYDITLTGKNEVSGIAVNETTKSAWYQVETTDSTDQSCKAVSVTEVKDDGTKDVVYVVKPYVAAFVTVTGIAGFADRKYASFAEAYAAIKPTIEKLGLGEESATADAFDALFTSVDANGNATLTYTISGTVVYDETDCANLLTMGRKASHYGNGRHLINFKFVGATGKEADTLTVNSDITLPYEWWSEKTTTGIHFENLTITGSAPNGLYPSQKFFEGIDFSVVKCVLKGIKIYNCSNVEGSYTITDSVLDGTGAPADSYAIHLQGNETAPLSITIKGNTISGYDRGINIDQRTAVATIEKNTISVTDTGRSCIQLSSLATTDIVGNTLELTGGNAITLHENLLTLSAAPKVSISGNTVTGTGYLIYDDAKANDKEFTSDNLKLTYATDNTIAETVDTTKGVKGSTAYITSTAVNNEVQHYVAQVGTTGYTTLAAAIAVLSAENHTLTLLKDAAWDATTPVYWAAGTQSGYAATLTDALTAAYKANEGAITIVCRPGADVGEMTHGHVADDLTIYGNDAYLSGGECDLEVDTYTFSRATGKQATDGAYLAKDITITAYELDNLGVWGERHTDHTVTVNLTDCDGKALEGKTNVQRVYISGTTGVNDITLTGCDFLTKATAVYSNADGAIKAVNCSFTDGKVPFNINHKANGTQTVAVENCTFTRCGDAGDWKQFAAPLRLVNSGTGTLSASVAKTTITDTVGANGDILLGDGRTGQASNDVELKVVNTAANIQAQKPGYYGGETVDATKKATAVSPAEGTLETSVAKLLPVDPRTLGYATSGKAEALPATPDMNGEVVNVTAAQAQYVLDGAYGPIDGKTINFTESINDTLILGRASKYDGSGTVYRHGSHDGEALSYADFIAYKNQSGWTESCFYERMVENVTFTANEGVTVKNFEADGGAHIYAGTAPVYDYVRDTGSWVTEGSCYFKRAILKNITFKGLTFKAKTDINTSESTTVYDGFTFKDCTFDLGTTADGNQAIRYYNENNNGNVKNLVVEGCTFKTCSQGVYTAHVKNVTVTGSTFDTTGHNAIAIQDHKGPCDHGKVVITGNTFKGIGDRIIRFNNVGMGTTVTITGNTADGNSGKLDKATGKREIVKATTLPVNAADSIKASGNDWGANTVVEGVFIDDYATKLGTEACPYSREQFAAMTRKDYITAQERLGGTLYVNVGDYAYGTDGVLGNGVRDDTPGQVPDHSELNAYGENGYLGEKNDGANGHAVVFVGGTITSDVTGYTSIDSIGTSLLLAVPAYTKVTFKGTAFKNVLSFDYQLYTSPWSQLGGLTFNGCTFDGIIVGAIASQELAFNGCTFNDYVNTTSANNSNPTWIRPAYGNWKKDDNEGQGTGFRSLTKITFENNTVTSTRPVKFERIAQWEMATTVTATGNTFAITPQEGDKDEKKTKNVGLYFGANAKFDLVVDKNKKSGETAALYTAVYSAPTGVTYAGLPAGSTVKNAAGEEVSTEDALAWKTTDKITLKTTTAVASVTNANGASVNFATLADAIAAAKDGETVKLLADVNGDGIAIAPNTFKTGLTVDFGGHTYTVGGLLVGSSGTASNGFQLNAGNRITFKNGAIVGATATAGAGTDWKGAPAILIQNYCDLTLEQMTVKGGDETCYTLSNNNGEIVIDGSTIVAGKGTKYGPFAFDVCRYASYPSVHVTVKGASVIEGNVEISGTIGDNQSRQLDIEGGTFKGAFTVVNQPANIAISGGTFSDAVLPEYCAAGFIPTANDDGTYGVKEGAYVARIGTTGYETLDDAIAAAKSGDTITLLADVVNTDYTVAHAVDIKLASGVTLDGNGRTISGNVKVTVASEGDVTIKNANFRDIHDAAVVSDAYKTKYGFCDDKVGTLSAIYAPKLAGALTISGCTFENCDWEAMQITPAEGAKIDIRNNVFKTSESEVVKEQLRHVHVEMAYGSDFDYEGTDIKLTITDNQFLGETKEANMGVWWVGKSSVLDVTGNYYANPDAVSITLSDTSFKRENRCDLIYPARSAADVDVDDLTAVALVVKDAFNATAHANLADAIAAANDNETVKMLADVVLTEQQTIDKAVVLDLNGKAISSTVNQFIVIVKGGDLTVNDATGEGRIENTTTEFWGGTILMTGGVLTLNGGTLAANTATGAYSPVIEAKSSATINVAGGRIEADRTGSVNAIQLGQNADATLNVMGGTIFGGKIGVYSYQYTGTASVGNVVNVSGGEIIGKSGNAVYAAAKTGLSISGGTLTPGGTVAALAIGGGSCTVTVGREGGVVGDVTIPSIDFKPGYSANMATVNLLSGIVQKFKDFDKMTVATVSQGKDKLLVGTDITACLPGSDLLCQFDAESGLYEIVKLTVENAVAIVTHDGTETPYRTVEQAVRAVADGDTLTLKVDHTGALALSAKNVTVDLGGKTLTYTGATGGLSSALSFNQNTASDNTVTVKNGTIVAKAQDATCVRAEMTGDLSKTLTVVFGENLTLTSGNTSRYGGVVFGTGARTASPCEKMTKGGLLVTEGEEEWIYGETATAFTHAKGSEVTLLNDWYDTDTKGTVKVPSSGTFASAKLNLNRHTISSYGVNPAVLMGMVGENEDTAAKTLEISSGTIKTSRHGAAVCGSNKTLTLDGVTLTTTGDKMYGLYANGTTSGNTVTLKNRSAVVSEKATGIYFPGAGTLTVEDSNVTGGVSGIEVRAGVLNVSGTSVIESTATKFSFTNDDNGITTTGAAVAAVKHTVGNDLAVTITGGTFKGSRGFYANDPNVAKPGTVTVSISGGVFSTDVEKKYLADGCKTVQQTIDGTLYYVVGPAITQIGVTLGGEKKEMPFPDAWLAANIGADAATWTTAALEEKAANELAKWQCYLFGLDPNKKEAKVVATAGQGTDETIPLAVANADASASPLVTGGYVTVAYALMGSNDRTAWTQVATSDKRDGLKIPLTGTTYKFYRVDVTVTSAEGN